MGTTRRGTIQSRVIWVLALVAASCSRDSAPPQPVEVSASDITEVRITASGPGSYGASLEVDPTGKVTGSDMDGTPNPFVHEYEKKLNLRDTEHVFDLARAVLAKDPGKDPIIEKNDIVYIVIRTSDGTWHAYFRDFGEQFADDRLNELDQALKTIDIGPTVHWP